MGKYNSSKYRVRPLMDLMREDYQLFAKVLKLVCDEDLSKPLNYWYDGEEKDCREIQLKPSKEHLTKLIIHMADKDFGNAEIKNSNRRKLCIPDSENVDSRKEAMEKALFELDKAYDNMTPSSKDWFIFEGYTCPDIFIEGEDYVIVCEGKWTEPSITEHTTHLTAKAGEYRNQMIRHIQGALNYTNKKIYAFYIADKECGYLKDKLSKEQFVKQLEDETIELGDQEKERIKDAFVGYTTWQDIEALDSRIRFKKKEEILE